jgi:DNA-binding NtrC family response regulator
MPCSTVLVFEKEPRWAPELERQLFDDEVRVRACRSTNDVLPIVDAVGQAVLVLNLEGTLAESLQLLGHLVSRAFFLPVIATGSLRTVGLEWSFRELGVVDFCADPTSPERLAKLCRKQLAPPKRTV